MSKNITHKVTIELSPGEDDKHSTLAENKVKSDYIGKYLTRTSTSASTKTYVYPEVHRILAKMVSACEGTRATIGGYLSEIVLEHFRQNRELMQSIFDDKTDELF